MRCTQFILAALAAIPALAPGADLLVLNKSAATLAFIDPASGKTNATVATGDGPHEIELSADRRLAFVSNYGAATAGNTLSVIDVKSRKELRRADLGELRRPHGLAYANGGVYFTAEQSQRIGHYDPKAQKVDWTFETGQEVTHMVLASRDGAALFATNIGSNSVSVISRRASDPWQQMLVAVGAGPEGLDLSPDERELWVAHSRDGNVSVIDTKSAKVVHTFDAGTKRSNRLKFTKDGQLVLVSDLGAGELVVIDAARRSVLTRMPVGRAPTGILVAPDGRRAYVACSGDDHLAIVDLKSMAVAGTIATGKGPDGMAFVE
jgi:YVTN family beta-propeller protein